MVVEESERHGVAQGIHAQQGSHASDLPLRWHAAVHRTLYSTSAPPAAIAAAASPFNTASAPPAAATVAAAPHASLWPVLCQPLLQARLVLLVQERPALVRQVEKLVKVPADGQQDADVDGEQLNVRGLTPLMPCSGQAPAGNAAPSYSPNPKHSNPKQTNLKQPNPQKNPPTCRPGCHMWHPGWHPCWGHRAGCQSGACRPHPVTGTGRTSTARQYRRPGRGPGQRYSARTPCGSLIQCGRRAGWAGAGCWWGGSGRVVTLSAAVPCVVCALLAS